MAEEQRRRKPQNRSGKPSAGWGQRSGAPGRQGRPRAGDGAPTPAPRAQPSHTLRMEVGGHGVELHCDTCDLVVTHLAGPEVRREVEATHRRHLGELTWESAWVAVCSCGWKTGRLGQQAARTELAAHEASVLRPAAAGRSGG